MSIDRADLDEFIGVAFADFAIADDFLEFLIEKFWWVSPVNIGFDRRKIELHKRTKKQFDYGFPRTIEFCVRLHGIRVLRMIME